MRQKKKGGFLGILLDTLGTNLLGNLFTGKLEQAKKKLEPVKSFNATLSCLKYKNIMKMNLNLMTLIKEITYLK